MKPLYALLVSMMSGILCSAQSIDSVTGTGGKVTSSVGLLVGTNLLEMTGKEWKPMYAPGILTGVFVRVSKGKLGVESDILFKTASNQISGSSGLTVHTESWDIPLLVEYMIADILNAEIGPQYTGFSFAKLSDKRDVRQGFRTEQYAVVAGAELATRWPVAAGARAVIGLTDGNTSNLPDGRWRSNSVQFFITYRIR